MAQGIVLTRSSSSVANLNTAVGTLPTSSGGTGSTTIGSPNQVIGVNAGGTALEYKTIAAGPNVTITNTAGQITISATGGGGSSLQLYAENPASPSPPSASGANSIALLSASSATAQDSLAIGVQSVARIRGGVVQASGRFASSGDAQIGRYTLRTNTINANPTTMFVDGTAGSVHLALVDNSTWTFRVVVTGHRTDAPDGHAGYELKGVVYRDSGAATTTIQGKVSKTIIAESNPSWDANVTADVVNGGIAVVVTGQVSKTIRWLALVESVEITN
jgi:hypothetical protein